MSDIIAYITDNWAEIAVVIGAVIFAAGKIADITPTETDNKILQTIRKIAAVVGVKLPDVQ